jgi:hypothetical protein
MDAPPALRPASADNDDRPQRGTRLDSWKEIATYLNRDLRTVQRWEKHGKLPVRRLQRPGLRAVFAYTGELDEWLQAQNQLPENAAPDDDAVWPPDVPSAAPPIAIAPLTVEAAPAPVVERNWRRPTALLATVAVAGLMAWWALGRNAVPAFPQFRARPITSDPSYDRDPAISPDGKFLAYAAVGVDRAARIFVRVLDGGEPKALTAAPDNERSPAWSPDGTRIAFLRGHAEASMTLLLTTPLGGQERTVAEIRPYAQRHHACREHATLHRERTRATGKATDLRHDVVGTADLDAGRRQPLCRGECAEQVFALSCQGC